MPTNLRVLDLATRIRLEMESEEGSKRTQINIARDFVAQKGTRGDDVEKQAQQLLRQLRRFPHLLE
jgi:hypothetical protein